MDDKQLADLLKYCSPKQLYIVTWNNILKLLFCPFKVLVLTDIGTLKKGQIVWVEEVKITQELKTVYIIKGQGYYYNYFDIKVDN
ncbi:hypothetical protein ACFQZW_11580 [Lutibacter aestuarii]|uniref:Uncharacterized protein n=1 Tax=Lutibacter aestuarii TaxID=861111 RepID=A0ABW2Z9R3_9FLAO